MNIINDCKHFYYNNRSLLFFIDLFRKYIIFFLCIIYLLWFPIYIIKTNNLHNFSNENITNIALIFYSFYKINSIIINKYDFVKEFIFEALFLISAIYDILNSNYLYHIEYCIICSIVVALIIFVYGTLYYIFKIDFDKYNNNNRELYYEFVADICSDIV